MGKLVPALSVRHSKGIPGLGEQSSDRPTIGLKRHLPRIWNTQINNYNSTLPHWESLTNSLTSHMSSSTDVIRNEADKICGLVIQARAEPPDANTLDLARQAGRIVTGLMREYIPNVTAIPPIVLSCAMELHSCCERGTISRMPNWGAIGYDDHRIMNHPHCKKAVVWMESINIAEDIRTVKVFRGGINWQETLQRELDQREASGQHKDDVGTRISHQSLTEEAVGLGQTSQISKPRQFGPARRKAAEMTGTSMEREKWDTEPKGMNQGGISSDTRDRKRKRVDRVSTEDVENSDVDLPLPGIIQAPFRKADGTAHITGPSVATETQEGVLNSTKDSFGHETNGDRMVIMILLGTEVSQDSLCTPCKKREVRCIIAYSKKTGHRLNSCEECTRKKQKCFYGGEPESVAKGRGRAMSRAKSRWCMQCRSPSRSRPGIDMESPHVVTPKVEASFTPSIPTAVGGTLNSIEERLVTVEAGLTKMSNAIEKLVLEREFLQHTVVHPHPTFPFPHGPWTVQTPISQQALSSEPRPDTPPDPPSSTSIKTGVQIDAAEPLGTGDTVDLGFGPPVHGTSADD
ncbi:hypothetical protein BDR06DRAFT_977934 [Suillus hirtellus]|nr:hypothetical protein BDR06DRAFT_977934 [Suillus hirtellus]